AARAGLPSPPDRATPAAAIPDCSRKARRRMAALYARSRRADYSIVNRRTKINQLRDNQGLTIRPHRHFSVASVRTFTATSCYNSATLSGVPPHKLTLGDDDVSDAPNVTSAPLAIGRYQVTDTLGEGGMGVVYLARDPQLERFVAIKLLRTGFDTSDMRERFGREARAVAALRHPYIVTLFEYGEHHGQPFIVMEYVSGKTLGSLIAGRAPMPPIRRPTLL